MQPDLFGYKPPPPVPHRIKPPLEWKLVPLRECPTPEKMQMCDTPQQAADYWHLHIPSHPAFDPECECFVVLHLNTRKRIRGHHFVSVGTLDSLLVHPREVFKVAIATSSAAIICLHNLCVAAHKLCYVELRVMCSCRLAAMTLTWDSMRRKCYAR